MSQMSDDDLIEELKKRFDHTKQALYDLKMVTHKLEEVNQKLEESEKLKSNFLSNIKNEINNPLTSIMGLADQLKLLGNSLTPDMVVAMGEMIHAEAFDLDFQLRNIFAAAELESGETVMHVTRVDITTLIKSTVDSFRHQLEKKGITVHLQGDVEGEHILFKTDSEKLSLVFSNLLSNAIEFNREAGHIYLEIRTEEGDQLTVAVRDTGLGVDEGQVHRLFDRFRQMESGSKKSHRGHGLGLSITKAVIDLMEGSISVHCEKDQGCTFTIAIPQVETDIEADAFSVDGNEFFFGDDQIEAF